MLPAHDARSAIGSTACDAELQAFLRGILANWLVNIAIWQATASNSIVGKVGDMPTSANGQNASHMMLLSSWHRVAACMWVHCSGSRCYASCGAFSRREASCQSRHQ